MAKRIRPISRIEKIEANINKIVVEAFVEEKDLFSLSEVWVPMVDICEKGQWVIIEMELPGVEREGISVLLHSNRVEIKGTKKENFTGKNIHYLRLEREFGIFRRLLFLPCIVVPESARATLEKGVLTITISKYTQRPDKEIVLKVEKAKD